MLRKMHCIKNARLLILLLTLAVAIWVGYIAYQHLHWQARLRAAEVYEKQCNETIVTLIDELLTINAGDIGYMPTVSGNKFLPSSDDDGKLDMLILGGPEPETSEEIKALVAKGIESVPCLMAHLDDARPTNLVLTQSSSFGGMVYGNEYDYNTKTTRPPIGGLSDVDKWEFLPSSIDTGYVYTVTVGDLCFVALGQIVNRNFSAVRYQPTMIVVINSPSHSPELLKSAMYEWGTLTLEQHKASLILDIQKPDYPDRRTGAIERLQFYYPDEAANLEFGHTEALSPD